MAFINSVTVNRDDLAHVIRLAALIEDQAPEEHRALAKIASQLDNSMNKGTRQNIEARGGVEASELLREVGGPIPKAIGQRWTRQIDRYYDAIAMYRAERRGA